MIEKELSDTDIAYQISARAFLNSLMREWSGWTLAVGEADIAGVMGVLPAGRDQAPRRFVRFALPRRGSHVSIEITHLSDVAYHGFRLPFREERDSGEIVEIGFPDFLVLLTGEPTIVGNADPRKSLAFLRRVLDSVANVEDVIGLERQASGNVSGAAAWDNPSFIAAEAALYFGHAVHPTPRSRDQFSVDDSRCFAPEYGNGFALRWWSATPDLIVHGSSRTKTAAEMSAILADSDPIMAGRVTASAEAGRVLLPMHPWQSARLMLDPAVGSLFHDGRLRDLGPAGGPWFATSSLRSIHASHADWMLKFSLSLRLTNSQRIVETYECERGLEVDKLLAGPLGTTIAQRFPTFRVMGEPAWLSLRGADGKALPQTTVVFRDNPFKGTSQPPAAVLAALCEIFPDGRESLLAGMIRRLAEREKTTPGTISLLWFEQFMDNVVNPFLEIQAEYGLLFGAHQQNLVVAIRDGWPTGVYFRDCQGTGYIEEFLPLLAKEAPGVRVKAGHIFAAAEAAQLVGYYLFINSIFAVIGALSTSGIASEASLLAILRGSLERLAARPLRDKTCLAYLLNSPSLASKGNFMICLRGINENTEVTDPLAGYVTLANPIAKVLPIARISPLAEMSL